RDPVLLKRDHGELNPDRRIDSALCFRYTMTPGSTKDTTFPIFDSKTARAARYRLGFATVTASIPYGKRCFFVVVFPRAGGSKLGFLKTSFGTSSNLAQYDSTSS